MKPANEERLCKTHGLSLFYPINRYKESWYFTCSRCMYEKILARRTKLIQEARDSLGGKCKLCGYDKCIRALHFHHLDPSTKSAGVAKLASSGNRKAIAEEAKKCVLLCANCHAEVESGLVTL